MHDLLCTLIIIEISLFIIIIISFIIEFSAKRKEIKINKECQNFIKFRNYAYEITSSIYKKKSDLRKMKASIMDTKDKLNYHPKNSEEYNSLLDEISEKQTNILNLEKEIKSLMEQRLEYAIRHEPDIEEIKKYDKYEYNYWKSYIVKIDNKF